MNMDLKCNADQFLNLTLAPKKYSKYQHSFPCLPKSYYKKGTGFHFIKVYKTASSTVAHVVKYIASNRGKCKEHSAHAAAYEFPGLKHRQTNQPGSFLFTFVREPTKRAVSDFFYHQVSVGKQEVNLSNFQRGPHSYLKLDGQAGFQLAYISTDERLPEYTFWNSSEPQMIQKPKMLLQRVNNVFDSYDFIGVSERLNESLVALSFLLNLDLTEISYVTYRQSGTFDVREEQCVQIIEAQLTRDMEEYLETDEWKAINAGDKLLHRAAIEALDNTIDNVIGRTVFEYRLKEYEALMELIAQCDELCSSPCTSDGRYTGKKMTCLPCINEKRKKWSDMNAR